MDYDEHGAFTSALAFPSLSGPDLDLVAQVGIMHSPALLNDQTILQLFSPTTSSNPDLAKKLQHDLQTIQSTTEAWGLIAGLSTYEVIRLIHM